MSAAGTEDEYLALRLLGVRVREVAELEEGALWIDVHRLLLVDAALSASQREAVACRVLGAALLPEAG